MKKITLFAAVFCSALASAQITYTSADYASAQENFLMTKAAGFIGMNFASTGANYNWNYGGMNADSQSTQAYLDPGSAGYKLSWCLTHGYIFNCNSQFNSNFQLATLISEGGQLSDYGVSNIIEHQNISESGLENRMRGMTAGISGINLPLTTDYSTPDVIYHFPIVYNDSYTTNGNFAMDLNTLGLDFQYTLAVQRTNTVQGWGSVTTPYGTFPNVLKMKSVIQKTETYVLMGVSIPIPTTTVSYQWFDKEYGMPVLQADGFEIFGAFVPLTVTYIDGPECLVPAASFTYIPTADYNPETGNATVSFNNGSSNYDSVLWDFGNGETSTDINPSHNYSCPGDKTVTLTVTNSVCQPDQTAVYTLPVTITDSQNALTTEVILTDGTLTATRNVSGTTYQWIDCGNGNAPIEGATSQSFTPEGSGSYACIMSTNGCEGTSECVALTILGNSRFVKSGLSVFPNPTSGKLQVSNPSAVKNVAVYNAVGMLVSRSLDLSEQSAGIYFVKLTTDEGTFTQKVVKE